MKRPHDRCNMHVPDTQAIHGSLTRLGPHAAAAAQRTHHNASLQGQCGQTDAVPAGGVVGMFRETSARPVVTQPYSPSVTRAVSVPSALMICILLAPYGPTV